MTREQVKQIVDHLYDALAQSNIKWEPTCLHFNAGKVFGDEWRFTIRAEGDAESECEVYVLSDPFGIE